MLTVEGPEAEAMRQGFVETDKVKPCPFCGAKFLEPLRPVSPIVFHPGIITDDSCALSGMGFRERQFALLNARANA